MFKKTLISLAVASSLGLTGCFDSGGKGGNANPEYQITDTTIDRSLVRPIFDPNPLSPTFSVPTHFDLLLLLGATQSANHDFTAPASGPEPVASALDSLSGFSTTSAFNVRFDGTLDEDSVEKGETVYLIALDTDPDIPQLPDVNPSDISGLAQDHQPNYRVDVVSVDGGADNAIRITPLEPLQEKRKYLVLVGNGVKGDNGKNIDQSVQARSVAEGPLGNPALANVKAILEGTNELGAGVLVSSDTPDQEVAIAYTFTTNGDADVLRAMASPEPLLPEIGGKVGVAALFTAAKNNYPELTFSELGEVVGALRPIATQVLTQEISLDDVPEEDRDAVEDMVTALSIQGDIGAAVQAQVDPTSEDYTPTLHVPQPRAYVAYKERTADQLLTIQGLEDGNTIKTAAPTVTVTEGAITLPYFQSLPGDDGTGITEGYWVGNTDFEDSLNNLLSPDDNDIFKFLRDADGSLNVNGNYPFPQMQAMVTVPVTIYRPNPNAQPPSCGGTVGTNAGEGAAGVTIFQHGIGVDRSTATLPAVLLTANTCQAVISLDQPLHGLAGDGSEAVPGVQPGRVPGLTALAGDEITDVEATAETTQAGFASALQPLGGPSACQGDTSALPESAQYACLQYGLMNQLLNSDYIGERHFGYTNDGELSPVEADLADITSGSLFVNPTNMLNSRDNLRQSVVDLLNLSATIHYMPIGGQPIFQGLDINFVGHSLGGISGGVYAALANDATIQGSTTAQFLPELNSVTLHATGGQVTRLLENSETRSDDLLGGLSAKGITQKTSNFENFFYVFQSIVDGTDSVNFAKDLGASTARLFATEVIGDDTVPNEANVNPLGDAYPAPLAGTEPLLALFDLGADGSSLADRQDFGIIDTSNTAGSPMPAAAFFAGNGCTEANHGTFVGPKVPNTECEGNEADTSAAFSVMVTQTAAVIGGSTAVPGDANALGISNTLENALDQDEAE